MDEDENEGYYQEHLRKLQIMIQQDVWMNRADMACGTVDKASGERVKNILSKYLEKIGMW